MTRLLLLLIAIVLGVAETPADDPAAGDLKKMQGDWMVATMSVNGMTLSDDEAQTLFRTVEGDKYQISRFSKPIGRGTFKLDATKSPRTIDSTPAAPADPGNL